jgi:hypothetical protein
MKRHLATRSEIAELNEFRKNRAGDRESKAPENSGLTREETQKALKSLPSSGQKIPRKLIPSLPS